MLNLKKNVIFHNTVAANISSYNMSAALSNNINAAYVSVWFVVFLYMLLIACILKYIFCGFILLNWAYFLRGLFDMEVKTNNAYFNNNTSIDIISERPCVQKKNKIGYFIIKRIFDIVSSACALVVLSPVFLITAIAIKCENDGPVVFSQERVGKDGKHFKMYKFRSMYTDAEERLKDLQEQNEADGPVFKIKNDPRITKVGHFIRKYSIDELMQLFNVFKGDMSVIGPRPALPKEVAEYDEYAKQRLLVKPGLSCYWQISGRSNIGFDEWMELDVKYINEMSFLTDIKIILKTIPAVLKGDGAC